MGPDAFGTKDSSYFHMAQLDHGLRDFPSTRQIPSSSLLSRSHLNKFHPSVYSSINPQGINSSSFIQQGHHHHNSNSSSSANPFGTYQHHSLLPRTQSVNLSPLEPLQYSRNKSSAYMGDFKSIGGDRGIGGGFLDSRMTFGSSSTSLPSASSNNMMFQANYTQPLLRASEGSQSCLEGALSNSMSQNNIGVNGLSRFPSNNTWQGSLKPARFPSNSLPLNHGFSQDQLTTFAGSNGMEDCTSLVSSTVNQGGENMQCEPQLLGDFIGNMNTLEGQKWEEQSCNLLNNPFGNLEYPVAADNMVFRDNSNANRSKGFVDESLMSPVDESATTLNNHQEYVGKLTMLDPVMKLGKPENAALVDNQHDVFDDIMNEMMKQVSNMPFVFFFFWMIGLECLL